MGAAESCDNRSQLGGGFGRGAEIVLAQTLVGKVGWRRIAAHAGRCGCGCGRGAASGGAVLRARIVDGLADRFHARVELDSFHVSLANGLWAEGKGLRIWPPARVEGVAVAAGQEGAKEAEPLIRLAEFVFMRRSNTGRAKPIHISVVELKGLNVHLPPKSHFEHGAARDTGRSESAGKPRGAAGLVRFEVETMECTGAELVLETSKPGKLPLEFAIAHLRLTNIASGGAMGFDAELTNPKPVGRFMRRGALGRGRQPTLANRRLPAITALSTRIWPASRGLRGFSRRPGTTRARCAT